MTLQERETKMLELLRTSLHALEYMDCFFFVCPGPDKPQRDISCTCHRCGAIYDINEFLKSYESASLSPLTLAEGAKAERRRILAMLEDDATIPMEDLISVLKAES